MWVAQERNRQKMLLGGELGKGLLSVFWLLDQSEPLAAQASGSEEIEHPDFSRYDLVFFGEPELDATIAGISMVDWLCSSKVPVIGLSNSAGTAEKLSLYAAGARYVICLDHPLSAVTACMRYLAKVKKLTEAPDRSALCLDTVKMALRDNAGRSVDLTLREVAALSALARKYPGTATHKELLESMDLRWEVFDERALHTFVSRFRKKLESAFGTKIIVSARSEGYKSATEIAIT